MPERQPSLPSADDQRSARNLLAWADRIISGDYGKAGSRGYENAVGSWQMNYRAFRKRLPDMEPIL